MSYGNFKDLFSKMVSDDALRITAFNIAKNPKYKVYLGVIISVDSKFCYSHVNKKNILFQILRISNKQEKYTNHLLEPSEKLKNIHSLITKLGS